jgi:cytosine/adenosine deaminase-related metal-dependent hydrolase
LYREMTSDSREKDIPISIHCAEAPADRAFFAAHDQTPMSYCSSVGLLGLKTVLVHMVHLDDTDVKLLANTGTHVVHCPSSNRKLVTGICRVPDLQEAGMNVALGADGAPCNNTCDMPQETRLAGTLHKVATV